jgi:HEAT repeat protein
VRGAAGKALGAFVFIAETRELDRSIQQEMEEALLHAASNDSNREVRDLCLRSLGFSSRPEVPNLIEEAFAAVGETRIAAALCAMARSANEVWGESVLAHLHDGSPIIRLEAIRAAGDIGLSEGVQELIELLEDVDESVRRASIWSLSQIGGLKASEVLNSLAETDRDQDEQETLQDAIDNLVFADNTYELNSFDQDDAQDPVA